MYPYHPITVQEISEYDKQTRIKFSNWLLQCRSQLYYIFLNDEAYFLLDGIINKYDCTIWALENIHKTVAKSLYSQKILVWMEFSSNFKLTLVFPKC